MDTISERRPFFSIIMPVYNVEKYIHESVKTVLNQTCGDFELIMVDDGSTDGCPGICDRFAAEDSRCRVIHQENAGVLAARRAGIKASAGEYLVHADPDDKCVLTLLEELKEIIESEAPDMIIYNYYRLYEGECLSMHEPLFEDRITRVDKKWLIKKFVSTRSLYMLWIKCCKRSIVDVDADYSGYGRLNMADDQLQSIPLIENAESILYLNRALYMYRDANGSITKIQNSKTAFDSLKAKSRMPEMLDKCGADKETYDRFYMSYCRTVNRYLLKNITYLDSYKEYAEFRDKIKACDIAGLRNASRVDKLLRRILYSKFYHIARLVGSFYVRSMNKKEDSIRKKDMGL